MEQKVPAGPMDPLTRCIVEVVLRMYSAEALDWNAGAELLRAVVECDRARRRGEL